MENISDVLKSDNGIPIGIMAVFVFFLVIVMAKHGYFHYQGKGLSIGKTENEVRAILLKQKEFVLQYCSYLTLIIISDMQKKGCTVSYVNTDYVIEKVVDEWLSWLIVNHVCEESNYLALKVKQTKLIVFKAVGKVNPELLQNEDYVDYFNTMCETHTVDFIKGVLGIYKSETKER